MVPRGKGSQLVPCPKKERREAGEYAGPLFILPLGHRLRLFCPIVHHIGRNFLPSIKLSR